METGNKDDPPKYPKATTSSSRVVRGASISAEESQMDSNSLQGTQEDRNHPVPSDSDDVRNNNAVQLTEPEEDEHFELVAILNKGRDKKRRVSFSEDVRIQECREVVGDFFSLINEPKYDKKKDEGEELPVILTSVWGHFEEIWKFPSVHQTVVSYPSIEDVPESLRGRKYSAQSFGPEDYVNLSELKRRSKQDINARKSSVASSQSDRDRDRRNSNVSVGSKGSRRSRGSRGSKGSRKSRGSKGSRGSEVSREFKDLEPAKPQPPPPAPPPPELSFGERCSRIAPAVKAMMVVITLAILAAFILVGMVLYGVVSGDRYKDN